MAMEMSILNTSDATKPEMMSENHPIMPAELFIAAIQGKSDIIVRDLGLPAEEQKVNSEDLPYMTDRGIEPLLKWTEVSSDQVTVEVSEPDTNQIQEENEVFQYNLESTTSSGETILHILIANRHNEFAKKVFQKYASMLKAQNKKLETPLHYAARTGNVQIIQSLLQLSPVVVEDALKITDNNKNTALHLAAKHGHVNVVRELLLLNHEVMNMVNNGGQSPFHIAVVESQTLVVQCMLEVDNLLAFTQFSDGMFPIHVAARIGNTKLVKHLLQKYSDSAEMLNQHGRNFFHIAAEEQKNEIFTEEFNKNDVMHVRMITAKDSDGNTPLHIATMKGNIIIMHIIWRSLATDSSIEPNNKGLTPFDLSVIQLTDTIQGIQYRIIQTRIERHVASNGRKFTSAWFDNVLEESSVPNKWERSSLIGVGSVLITTVTFAAAFTIPGGYNADHGVPILGRRFMFRAFIYSNAMSFIYAFISVFVLVFGSHTGLSERKLSLAANFFLSGASFMVLTFGTGTYVTLAPVNEAIATTILTFALALSPATFILSFGPTELWKQIRAGRFEILLSIMLQFLFPLFAVLIVFGGAALQR